MPGDDIQDDLTISDDAILIRRVPPWHWKSDEGRVDMKAFRLRKGDEYLSVFLKGEVTVDQVIAAYTAKGRPGIVFLKAGDIRAMNEGFRIRREPDPKGLAGHCGIYGEFTREQQDRIRKIAEVIRIPVE